MASSDDGDDPMQQDDDHVPGADEMQQDGDQENDPPPPPEPPKPTRGVTTMKKVVQHRNKNKGKYTVSWNTKGQPIGKNGASLMSYLGSFTRSVVPITAKKWKEVSHPLKAAIWEDVSRTYEVPISKRKWLISQAARMFRDFKSQLTRNWIFDEKGEIREDPPELYHYIKKDTWTAFVESRLKPEFKIVEQKLPSTTTVPRSQLWKKSRTNKKGQIKNKKVKKVADQIDALTQKGEIDDEGPEDILYEALGKIVEHPGRVRGIGYGVTPTQLFGPRDPFSAESEVKELKTVVKGLSSKVTELELLIKKDHHQHDEVVSTNASFSEVPNGCRENAQVLEEIQGLDEIPEGVIPCQLALKDPTYRIVGTGKIFNTKGQTQVIHCVSFKEENVRVSVTYVNEDEKDSPLSASVGDLKILRHAIGTFVPWPKSLIVYDKVKVVKIETDQTK